MHVFTPEHVPPFSHGISWHCDVWHCAPVQPAVQSHVFNPLHEPPFWHGREEH